VRNNVDYGVLKLTLHPNSYDWQFLAKAGGSFTDSGTTTCHEPPPPPPPPTPQTPTVRSVSSNVANRGTTLPLSRPAGTTSGDVLLAVIAHQVGQFRNMTPPAGWTAVPNTDWAEGNNVRIHAWYKVAGSSEPASYTFTLTGGSGQDISGGMLAISGASSTSPIHVAGGAANPNASRSVTAPSITTTLPDALLLYGGACNNAYTFTAPPGMTEQWDRATSSANSRVSTEVATQAFPTPGATGDRTALASNTCRSVAIQVTVVP
jgi:hypothetical protein